MTPHLQSSGPLRFSEDERGELHGVADFPPEVFRGAFFCWQAGAHAAHVSLGTINNDVPLLDGISLDGYNADKQKARVPDIDLSLVGPGVDLRSWLCLQVRVDLTTGKPPIVDGKPDRNALTIVHLNDLSTWFSNGLALDDGEGRGIKPIAMIVWQNGATIQRIHQLTWFNQAHSFTPAKGATGKGIHTIKAVA